MITCKLGAGDAVRGGSHARDELEKGGWSGGDPVLVVDASFVGFYGGAIFHHHFVELSTTVSRRSTRKGSKEGRKQ